MKTLGRQRKKANVVKVREKKRELRTLSDTLTTHQKYATIISY